MQKGFGLVVTLNIGLRATHIGLSRTSDYVPCVTSLARPGRIADPVCVCKLPSAKGRLDAKLIPNNRIIVHE